MVFFDTFNIICQVWLRCINVAALLLEFWRELYLLELLQLYLVYKITHAYGQGYQELYNFI